MVREGVKVERRGEKERRHERWHERGGGGVGLCPSISLMLDNIQRNIQECFTGVGLQEWMDAEQGWAVCICDGFSGGKQDLFWLKADVPTAVQNQSQIDEMEWNEDF